jgi:hypothetical protein
MNARTETKTCSACGARFECGARGEGCWCQQLPALPAALLTSEIDCFCPRCLAARTRVPTPDVPRVS